MPSRIQRQRSRGWRQPINAIYVGRPPKLESPHKVGTGHHTAEEDVTFIEGDMTSGLLPFTNDDVRPPSDGQGSRLLVRTPALHVMLMCCRGQFLTGLDYGSEEMGRDRLAIECLAPI